MLGCMLREGKGSMDWCLYVQFFVQHTRPELSASRSSAASACDAALLSPLRWALPWEWNLRRPHRDVQALSMASRCGVAAPEERASQGSRRSSGACECPTSNPATGRRLVGSAASKQWGRELSAAAGGAACIAAGYSTRADASSRPSSCTNTRGAVGGDEPFGDLFSQHQPRLMGGEMGSFRHG